MPRYVSLQLSLRVPGQGKTGTVSLISIISKNLQFYFSHIFQYFVCAVENKQRKFTERLSHVVVISLRTQRNQK